MDKMVENFNKIIEIKEKEIEEILLSKNKKMTNKLDKNDLDYATKKTISKIKSEEKRKYESSKLYKKKQDNI
jgi:hypothetical protein